MLTSLLGLAAASLVGTLLALWLAVYARTGDASAASAWLQEKVGGILVGAVASAAWLLGFAAAFIDQAMQIPSVLLALLGVGQAVGAYDLSPGMFAIGALAAFAAAMAWRGGRQTENS